MALIKNESKQYKVIHAKDMGDFVSVTLNTADKILIPLEDYFMMALRINSPISIEVVDKYRMYQDLYNSYLRVKNRVLTKDQTTYDIKQYCIKNCGLSGMDLETIMNMVMDTQLLDDRKFAKEKSIYWQQSGKSIQATKEMLRTHGIQENMIDEVCANLDYDLERENAYKCLLKYKDSIKGKSIFQYKQTLIQKLMQKGFCFELSKDLCEQLELDKNIEQDALSLTIRKAKRLYSNDKYKIKKYCMRKGFSVSQINDMLEGEIE